MDIGLFVLISNIFWTLLNHKWICTTLYKHIQSNKCLEFWMIQIHHHIKGS
jgi:hypothetical protein